MRFQRRKRIRDNPPRGSSGNSLSQGSVLSRVMGALTVSGGVATLAQVDPFPVGTEYHVPYGTTITYGVADGAAITAAAEGTSRVSKTKRGS